MLLVDTADMTLKYDLSIPDVPFLLAPQESPTELFVEYTPLSGEPQSGIGSIGLSSGNYNPAAGECPIGMLGNIVAVGNNQAYCAEGGTIVQPVIPLKP